MSLQPEHLRGKGKQNASAWTSVEDELPKMGDVVLVYDNSLYYYPYDTQCAIAVFKGEYEHSVLEGSENVITVWELFEVIETGHTRKFSHWMRLPEPPKEYQD